MTKEEKMARSVDLKTIRRLWETVHGGMDEVGLAICDYARRTAPEVTQSDLLSEKEALSFMGFDTAESPWLTVPLEPTEKMRKAGYAEFAVAIANKTSRPAEVYRAMIAAAPPRKGSHR